MPIYDYMCDHCGLEVELIRVHQEAVAPIEVCSRCRGPLVRLPSAANFTIKGYSYANGYSRKDTNEQD